jgi:hypothetical protein
MTLPSKPKYFIFDVEMQRTGHASLSTFESMSASNSKAVLIVVCGYEVDLSA